MDEDLHCPLALAVGLDLDQQPHGLVEISQNGDLAWAQALSQCFQRGAVMRIAVPILVTGRRLAPGRFNGIAKRLGLGLQIGQRLLLAEQMGDLDQSLAFLVQEGAQVWRFDGGNIQALRPGMPVSKNRMVIKAGLHGVAPFRYPVAIAVELGPEPGLHKAEQRHKNPFQESTVLG